MSGGKREVIDLCDSPAAPTKKSKQVEVVVLDDSGDRIVQEVAPKTRVLDISSTPPPPPLPVQPRTIPMPSTTYPPLERLGNKIPCRYGSECRKQHNAEHRAKFSHPAPPAHVIHRPYQHHHHNHGHNQGRTNFPLVHRHPAVGGASMGMGGGVYQAFLEEQRRLKEEEERVLVEAIASSLRAEQEDKEKARLRKMQDDEYLASVEADMKKAKKEKEEKEEEKRKEAERLEAERIWMESLKQQKEEEEEEEEEEKQKKKEEEKVVSNTHHHHHHRRRVVLDLDPEPEPNADEEGVVKVTFQLPDATRVSRRFRASETGLHLYAHVEELTKDLDGYVSIVKLPQGEIQMEQTLNQIGGGAKSVLLFVKMEEIEDT